MNILITNQKPTTIDSESVELKGRGHPDTLSDGLAEFLSKNYSVYTLERFGAVLHHNFDKVGLLGGSSEVKFGSGKLISPIRVLLNGRASSKFGNSTIPLEKLLKDWSTKFLLESLPLIGSRKNLNFFFNLGLQSSPGKTEEEINQESSSRKYWFEPRGFKDIPELKNLVANDTSIGVGFAPFTNLENLLVEIEKTLNGKEYQTNNPWIGSDIKIMAYRYKESYNITICIPQIANEVSSVKQYQSNLEQVKFNIETIAKNISINNLEIDINTRDDEKKGEFYLTAIGSSIESGDEGLVGRGNRLQGFISQTRPMSMEGAAGKNPVYHIGKVYYATSQQISNKIYKKFGLKNEISLISQSGRDLLDPWSIIVSIYGDSKYNPEIKRAVEQEILRIPIITEELISGKIKVY